MDKICFPLEGLNSSGGVRIITYLANGFSENGFEVEIILPDYSSSSFYSFSKKVKLRIIKTPNNYFRKIYYCFFLIFLSAKKKYKFSIATGYRTPFYIICSKLFNFSSVNVVYIIQHYEISSQIKFQKTTNAFFYLLNLVIAKFGYIYPSIKIAVSEWIKQNVNNSNIYVIPNGIDFSVFNIKIEPSVRNLYTVGIIGSIKPIKGYNIILDAISKINKNLRSKMNLLILSNDGLRHPNNIKVSQIQPNSDNDIAEFYKQCNIFVFASYEEGFGLPPLEAMASGCIVISSDCGGVRTFLDDSCAIFFKPGNSNELAEKIEFIFENIDKLEDVRNEGIKKSKLFSDKIMLLKYLELLNNVAVK